MPARRRGKSGIDKRPGVPILRGVVFGYAMSAPKYSERIFAYGLNKKKGESRYGYW